MYLCDGVKGVRSLGGVEVGVENAARQLAADQNRLHHLTHGLFGAQSQVEAALGAPLPEGNVVLDVYGDGHQAAGGGGEEEEERGLKRFGPLQGCRRCSFCRRTPTSAS